MGKREEKSKSKWMLSKTKDKITWKIMRKVIAY